jgi:hypothetical protein
MVSFPLGVMGPSINDVPPDLGTLRQKLTDVASMGHNIVLEFKGVQAIWEAEAYLREAEQVGLYVVQNMPICRAYESDEPICQQYPVDLWNDAQWSTFIQSLSAYDNLVAWFLPDEIDDLEVAAHLAQLVRENDPRDRPIYANPGSTIAATINQFPAFTDFLWAVGYPELEQEPRALVKYMMDLDRNACQGTDSKYGAILQFFDSSAFPDYGIVGHPSAHQLRADTYQAIINGAQGVWYFSYELGRGFGLDEQWAEMATIADEINGSGGLAEVILAPDVEQGVVTRILSGPTESPLVQGEVTYDSIQYLQKWQEGDGTYLFATNVATDTLEVEFTNLWAETDTVQVLFEDRTIPILNDTFTDTFGLDDVHIYYYAAPEPAVPVVDLTVSISDLPDPAVMDLPLTYVVTVANSGPSPATAVTVTDTLPADMFLGAAIPSQGTCSGTSLIICDLGALDRDASATITLTVAPTSAGTFSNTASATASELEPNTADNTATEQTAVNALLYLPIVLGQ